jgi:REP element-mobilizing transposase RayT
LNSEYEGAFYHLLLRDNDPNDIFMDDKNRNTLLHAVGAMSERFASGFLAFVFMDNHATFW